MRGRDVMLAVPVVLVAASGILAVFGVWLWAFWLLGAAIWVEVGL
jgi:hypothetical protein